MKNISYLFYGLGLFMLSACSQTVAIENGDLSLAINDKMHFKLSSLADGTAAYYDHFVPANYLVAREFTANEFKLSGVSEDKQSDKTVYTLTGNYRKGGYDIEQLLTVTAADAFPGMLLLDVRYVNNGLQAATVTAWTGNELRMKNTSKEDPVWSLQTSSTNARKDWILPVSESFYQKNYMGMNNSDYGGGIPVSDLWRKDGGFAVGLTEMTLKLVSLPVQMNRNEDFAQTGILYEYEYPVEFKQNDTIQAYSSFISVHTGDFFDPLRQFSNYMQSQGITFAEPNDEAFEAVWCAWGYERTFTINEVLGTLPKVKELGFKWVDVDDGFQICEGDWEPNSRFPGGDRDMRRIADVIHGYGLKAKLWWAPMAADPSSNILKKYPEIQLQTKDGTPQYVTWWDSYYLSPVNPVTQKYTADLVKRFIDTWDFDGLKLDGHHLNCCPPDHNPASKLDYPEQAIEQLPSFYQNIFETARKYKPNAVVQNCPCGDAMNFFNMQYMNQAVSSDPLSSWQIRLKGKVYKAIFDKMAYYADHVELSDNGNDFPTQIGIGAVVGSKFTYPKDNPDVKISYLLTPEKGKLYKKWVDIYNDKMLSKGEYLNLYDLVYEKPETHVIRKDGKMYYAFYADDWNGEIRLKGLENKPYTVKEYTHDEQNTYIIDGSNPLINTTFKGNYLIEVY